MKRIGVVVSKNSEGGLGIPGAYAQYLANYGMLFPINALDSTIHNVDLLVLPGGADINPFRYEGTLSYFTQNSNIQLEHFDANILPQYITNKTPIFGICRGFQTLNVVFGGKLSQHIAQEYSEPRDKLCDEVILINENKHYINKHKEIINKNQFKVNSLHHQGFFIGQEGTNVIPILRNKEYMNIEAFVVENMPIAAVQWHPEEIYDSFSATTIRYLLNNGTF